MERGRWARNDEIQKDTMIKGQEEIMKWLPVGEQEIKGRNYKRVC